jgi:Tyrosine phosphatase family
MINRFREVCPGLYRGSAPSPDDVSLLHEKLGIRKIISLDKLAAKNISRICQALKIEHIIIPINGLDPNPLNIIFDCDLKKLLLSDDPTYVHCRAGKDRTGMICAMFECRYLGIPADKAIEKAKKIGFGLDLNPAITHLYTRVIKEYAKKHQNNNDQNNNNDVVSNSRPGDDWRGSVLDAADMSSFAPFIDPTRYTPFINVYDYKSDQANTRGNYDIPPGQLSENVEMTGAPMVGLYDNDAGIHGSGVVESPNAFSGTAL